MPGFFVLGLLEFPNPKFNEPAASDNSSGNLNFAD